VQDSIVFQTILETINRRPDRCCVVQFHVLGSWGLAKSKINNAPQFRCLWSVRYIRGDSASDLFIHEPPVLANESSYRWVRLKSQSFACSIGGNALVRLQKRPESTPKSSKRASSKSHCYFHIEIRWKARNAWLPQASSCILWRLEANTLRSLERYAEDTLSGESSRTLSAARARVIIERENKCWYDLNL